MTDTELTLTCVSNYNGSMEVNYQFYKETQQTVNGYGNTYKEIVQDDTLNTYIIPSVTTAHSGNYTCVVTIHGVESSQSSSHSLTVVRKYSCHWQM